MKRSALIYFLILSLLGLGVWGVLQWGITHLPQPVQDMATAGVPEPVLPQPLASVVSGLVNNLNDPLGHLFIQLLVIIAASRCVGVLFVRCGQPAVVGEMVAGILLGPSLFGLLMPSAFQFVFPATSLGVLKLLSQIGVCLFMFVVGMELNVRQLRNSASTAVVVSHASIVIPYFLGVVLACFLYAELAAPGASFLSFALFIGISMSITAFPVLARILQERGLTRTSLGNTAITCAAVDDVTAWSILAFVVAISRAANIEAAAFNLGLVLIFVAAMIWGVRPLLPRVMGRKSLEGPTPSRGALVTVICVVLAAALCTETIGIHALFGAFLAGTVMPNLGDFRERLGVRIESFSSILLLPLFFAFTGLRTQIGSMNTAADWILCLVITLVATVGKFGGSALIARAMGVRWRESLQLGALMNTRGLMELIALNIGYDLHILSPRIFAMLVIMAVVTTMMTGPLLTWFRREREIPGGAVSAA